MREFQPGDRVCTGSGYIGAFVRRDTVNAIISRDDGIAGALYPGYWSCTYEDLVLMGGPTDDSVATQKADPPGQPPNTTDPKKWPFPTAPPSTPIEEKEKDDVWARHKAFMRGMR